VFKIELTQGPSWHRDILNLEGAIEQQEQANPEPLVVKKIIRFGEEDPAAGRNER
jgi:hypothetical protein